MPHPIDRIRKMLTLPPEVEEQIKSQLQERTYKRGERIEGRGNIANNEFYIVSGMARVYYIENGREHTYSFAIEDEFVVMSGTLMHIPDNLMCIEFLENTTVIFIPHKSVQETIHELMPDFRKEVSPFVMTALIEHIRHLDERLLMLQNTSARSRYEWFVKRYPRLLERAPITQIASFLGVTKETLYRIRSDKYSGK